jgi:hypothetical protein
MKQRMLKITGCALLALFITVFVIVNPVFHVQKSDVSVDVNAERLRMDVEMLVGDGKPRYYTDIDALNVNALYIEKVFHESDCQVEVQTFVIAGNAYKNIICSYNVDNTERIIVGAHYDTDSHTPGADDNASGVAGVLELSRLLTDGIKHLDYRVDLIAYSLEEAFFGTEHMGSYVHAQSLRENDGDVLAMVSLEMIGYYSDQPGSQNYPFSILQMIYPSRGDFIAVVGDLKNRDLTRKVKKHFHQAAKIDAWSINAPVFIPGIDFSDHFGYWAHDYPAVMVTDTSFYRNHNYHKKTDTIDTLNFDAMAEVVKGVYWFVMQGA